LRQHRTVIDTIMAAPVDSNFVLAECIMNDELNHLGQESPGFTFGGVTLAPKSCFHDWQSALGQAFETAGIRTPLIDAGRLILAALNSTGGAESSRPITSLEASRIAEMAHRRIAREPVSRILGRRKFYGREFDVTPATLDPRRDTEALIRSALAIVDAEGWRDAPIQILDLGVGSGAILVTLLAELPQAAGLGVDLSAEALETAQANVCKLGVADRTRLQQADWLDGVSGSFQIVTTNPPYLSDEEIAQLAPEAGAYDPRLALDGGHDGMKAYQTIIPALKNVLSAGGWCIFEVGPGQAAAVEKILVYHGFNTKNRDLSLRKGLYNVERVVAGKRQAVPG
jgi:release factor glutamine methyltransferase